MSLKDLIADVNVNEIYEHIETETLSDWVNAWQEAAITALRPVSREQVEKVFPGCPACKNGPPKLHIPAFRAMAVCNQHMDHEAFDIELNSKFCLNCGRPLTDKAVDMLMERMEALHGDR